MLYLVYSCPYLALGLCMSYLCDLFLFFRLIFIVINHITSLKRTHLLFVHCFFPIFLDGNLDEIKTVKAQSQGVN